MSNTDIQDDYVEWVTIHTLNTINISLHKMIYYKFGNDKTYACVLSNATNNGKWLLLVCEHWRLVDSFKHFSNHDMLYAWNVLVQSSVKQHLFQESVQ